MKTRHATLPLRSLLLVAIALLAVLPCLGGGLAWLAADYVQHAREHHAVVTAEHYLANGRDRWGNPEWQRKAIPFFHSLGADAEVTRIAATSAKIGKPLMTTVFATPGLTAIGANKSSLGPSGNLDSHRLRLSATKSRSFNAVIITPRPNRSTPLIAASLGAAGALLVALLITVWLIDRWVVSPIRKLSQAAEQVAGGDLSIAAPRSRAREVADVGQALVGMTDALGEARMREHQQEQEQRFLITALAHDLRTPLFTLRGYLEALEGPRPGRHYLRRAIEKAALLETLLGQLFAYSHREYAAERPQTAPVEFAPFLAGVLREFEQQAATKKIRLSLSGPEEPVVVALDRQLLTRALGNLLENALRHTPQGGVVEVEWEARGESVAFSIRDTGEGIPADDLPHIFEPRYRADTANNDSSRAGLGLAIARRLIELHGGTLTADNVSGGGATLSGNLPRFPRTTIAESAAAVR